MKTLSINPFNLKPQIKRLIHSPKHVEIPATISEEFGNKLLAVQGSLDYMATNYGINFKFIHWPFKLDGRELNIDKVVCKGKDSTSDTELIHDRDDEIDVAKNIYMAVSRTLNSNKQKADKKIYGVTTKNIPEILEPTFKIYSGLLEYYAKKYDGMTFKVIGKNVKGGLYGKNSPHIVISCKYNSNEDDIIISKVDHAAHASDENAFYTAWGHNLNDFYEDKVYEKIHKMVKNVLKGENE